MITILNCTAMNQHYWNVTNLGVSYICTQLSKEMGINYVHITLCKYCGYGEVCVNHSLSYLATFVCVAAQLMHMSWTCGKPLNLLLTVCPGDFINHGLKTYLHENIVYNDTIMKPKMCPTGLLSGQKSYIAVKVDLPVHLWGYLQRQSRCFTHLDKAGFTYTYGKKDVFLLWNPRSLD